MIRLSPRVRELIELIAIGKTNKEIAYIMKLSDGTVKTSISRLYLQIRVSNRVEATLWWLANKDFL